MSIDKKLKEKKKKKKRNININLAILPSHDNKTPRRAASHL